MLINITKFALKDDLDKKSKTNKLYLPSSYSPHDPLL